MGRAGHQSHTTTERREPVVKLESPPHAKACFWTAEGQKRVMGELFIFIQA